MSDDAIVSEKFTAERGLWKDQDDRAQATRVRLGRIRDRIVAAEREVENGGDCLEVLYELAECREEIRILSTQLLEHHIAERLARAGAALDGDDIRAARELIRVAHRYLS